MSQLEKSIPVHPSAHALEICQDRLKEKTLFNKLNIETTNFFPTYDISDLNKYRKSNQSYILNHEDLVMTVKINIELLLILNLKQN